MIEERFESYVYEIMKYVKYQENKPYIESILEDMKYTLYREDREYIKELQQENKQLKEEKKQAIEYNKSILKEKWYGGNEKKYAKKNLEILGDKK